MQLKIYWAAFFSCLLMIGCAGNDKQKPVTPSSGDSTITTSPAKAASGNKTPKAEIKVTITGSDMAGTYEATSRKMCCSYGIAGKNVFGNQYSEEGKGPKELSSVQLLVDNVTGDKSTTEFYVDITFGELFGKSSKTFAIHTQKNDKIGSGKLDIKYDLDNNATVKIVGKTNEGVGIDLTMVCMKVMSSKTPAEEMLEE